MDTSDTLHVLYQCMCFLLFNRSFFSAAANKPKSENASPSKEKTEKPAKKIERYINDAFYRLKDFSYIYNWRSSLTLSIIQSFMIYSI